ncbi:diphosphomevalonate decarboxylase-like isoform X2 [Haliotis rufescens]|uniref:diphosphomevalonate decarboxylase-like isoform X1 n=1 Tax=Haliotis rufescens TaxID=6454 RepID=UPI00201F103D|nr:diphosphomevalonate decarboxylase-like isoform X1 [Haliotis rufescens]XP_046356601.2 diphosphomevalonate decarboxylase-like isoform X2 [Haliotis rufescens]
MRSVTCTAPVNIAVIKYWGKRDETLILPINSSLSVTLGQNELRAKTTVAISKSFKEDKIWLNGKEQSVDSPRIQNVLKEIRRRTRKRSTGDVREETLNMKVHICSENNFPTAAGLASSAAGYACLVYSLAKLFGVKGEISDVARQGSGSACRSVYGGFVLWDMGKEESGKDSLAKQVAPADHWPQLRVLILVVSDQKKHTSSTEGMQTSVKTSELLKKRVDVVPQRVNDMVDAIKQKDFQMFAEITMKESNQFHAVCLDTYPPISYMTDTSRQIVRLVHAFNKQCTHTKVAYTFDAGPNACLYLLEEDVARVVSLIKYYFPMSDNNTDLEVRGLSVESSSVEEHINNFEMPRTPDAIKYIIHTQVGEGPQVVEDSSECLLDNQGLPINVVS